MSKAKNTKTKFPPSVPFRVEEHLRDAAVREAYDALDQEFALVRQLIDLRQKTGLSQRQLAQRAGMQQPVIARLEGGRPASLGTLRRVAAALGAQLELRLVPRAATSTTQHRDGRRSRPKRS
jgi:ribosome-binding protein aMBF1 (putative translation factor)